MKKDQDGDYELLRGLHIDSQTSGQGKGIIRVAVMQKNFSSYVDGSMEISFDHLNRVSEFQKLGRCVHMAMEEIHEWLNVIKDYPKGIPSVS